MQLQTLWTVADQENVFVQSTGKIFHQKLALKFWLIDVKQDHYFTDKIDEALNYYSPLKENPPYGVCASHLELQRFGGWLPSLFDSERSGLSSRASFIWIMMYEFNMGLLAILSSAGVYMGQQLEVKTLLTNH